MPSWMKQPFLLCCRILLHSCKARVKSALMLRTWRYLFCCISEPLDWTNWECVCLLVIGAVLYLEHARAGISLYGFVLDRGFLYGIFGVIFSVTLFIIGKTIIWESSTFLTHRMFFFFFPFLFYCIKKADVNQCILIRHHHQSSRL